MKNRPIHEQGFLGRNEEMRSGFLNYLLGGVDLVSDHYYTNNPESKSDMREIRTEIRGRAFTFTTDASVFSKRSLDYGTRTLIEHIPFPLTGDVLDVGCGYGPIGLAVAAFSPRAEVTMVDINRRALELCRLNAEHNMVKRVEITESDGLSALTGRQFDCILTNPPIRAGKRVVYHIFEDASRHLRPSGEFWLVIHKKQGAPSAVKKLQTIFPKVTVVAKDRGYHVVRCRLQ